MIDSWIWWPPIAIPSLYLGQEDVGCELPGRTLCHVDPICLSKTTNQKKEVAVVMLA